MLRQKDVEPDMVDIGVAWKVVEPRSPKTQDAHCNDSDLSVGKVIDQDVAANAGQSNGIVGRGQLRWIDLGAKGVLEAGGRTNWSKTTSRTYRRR